eukprot:m.488233 g.488233  ORF g.488233 m.488233 type:complete len:480 (-) comp25662_c0_seq1:327-1766(-)
MAACDRVELVVQEILDSLPSLPSPALLRWVALGAAAVAAVRLSTIWRRRRRRREARQQTERLGIHPWDYETLKTLVDDEPLPAALVHLPLFDANLRSFGTMARAHGKTIRIATKSIRVPHLIARCADLCPDVYKGFMCFSTHEALFLASAVPEADDFLVAYPVVQQGDVAAAARLALDMEKRIHLMVDCAEHVTILDRLWQNELAARDQPPTQRLAVCIDVDMSYRPFGNFLHLGVHRSPCRTLADFIRVYDAIQESTCLRLSGVMGYEAQIAGVPDDSPLCGWVYNLVLRAMKFLSFRDVVKHRQLIRRFLDGVGADIEFFNGGGSGSAEATVLDPSLTEMTVGSGLLQSALFDWFADSTSHPALCFGLRVTRSCGPGVVCCQSGGFVASGEVSNDKTPQPYLPSDIQPFTAEGYGEVQSPFRINAGSDPVIGVGDPVFLRPAKAGEIAERFLEYILTNGREVLGRAKTYRGHGSTFF